MIHNKGRGEKMKNTIISMSLGMAGGMALATYMLSNQNVKKKVEDMVDNAMDNANLALDDMKKTLKKN